MNIASSAHIAPARDTFPLQRAIRKRGAACRHRVLKSLMIGGLALGAVLGGFRQFGKNGTAHAVKLSFKSTGITTDEKGAFVGAPAREEDPSLVAMKSELSVPIQKKLAARAQKKRDSRRTGNAMQRALKTI
jgi:hypothetical protein